MYGFMIAVLLLSVYLISHSDIMLRTKVGSTMSAAYIGLILLIIPLLFIYYNQKYLVKICVDNNSITFKSLFRQRPYSASEIQSIDLFARNNLGFLSGQRKSNGISIVTHEKSYFLNDLYYRNTAEIKVAIYNTFKSVVSNKNEEKNVRSSNITFAYPSHEKFYNNFLLSPNPIAIVIGYVISILLLKQEGTVFIVSISLGLLIMFILLFVFKANYFVLSSKQLIVKNQLLWNKNIVFDFDQIVNVVIEKAYRQSNTLRINTKDFQSRTFQAGGLWDSTWKQLIQELKTCDIQVENDIFL